MVVVLSTQKDDGKVSYTLGVLNNHQQNIFICFKVKRVLDVVQGTVTALEDIYSADE